MRTFNHLTRKKDTISSFGVQIRTKNEIDEIYPFSFDFDMGFIHPLRNSNSTFTFFSRQSQGRCVIDY